MTLITDKMLVIWSAVVSIFPSVGSITCRICFLHDGTGLGTGFSGGWFFIFMFSLRSLLFYKNDGVFHIFSKYV